ncbi:MAG: ParA family protein [Chloroflexi bacterium]|nr:ParA family protein [Chloroflexota bacterium]
MEPLTVAIAHSKGGVGKTTTTIVVGKYLARDYRVLLKDYDDTRQLSDLVRSLTGDEDLVTRNLRLANDEVDVIGWRRRAPDVVLIDAEPARGPRTWQALKESEFVLVPAPPEGLAVRAMRQMFETIGLVREQANPFLTIMGVIPTMYDKRWPEHRAFLEEMQRECDVAGVRLFTPVARRQSYLYLSTRGQDYKPVAQAIANAVRDHKRARQIHEAASA